MQHAPPACMLQTVMRRCKPRTANWIALCGTTFTTLHMLPRHMPVKPPLAHMRRAVATMLVLRASAIIMVRSRSKGAVTARAGRERDLHAWNVEAYPICTDACSKDLLLIPAQPVPAMRVMCQQSAVGCHWAA